MKIKGLRVVGWGLSLSLIIFAVFYFDWRQIFNNFRRVNPWLFLLLLLIYVLDFFLRTYRWKILLYPVKKTISFPKLFCSYNIAHFANIFLPARTGELFRVFITGKEENISKRAILGTLITEKFFDVFGMGMLIIFAIFFLKTRTFKTEVPSAFLFWALVFLTVFFSMVLSVFLIKHLVSIKHKSRIGNRIAYFIQPVFQGFSSIQQLSLVFLLAGLSIFMWILNAFILYLYMLILSLGTKYFDSIIVLLFQLLGEFIPSAPSSVGTFHASTVIGSKFVGLTPDQGLALGLLNHSYDLVIRIIFGLTSIYFINFDFRRALRNIASGDMR